MGCRLRTSAGGARIQGARDDKLWFRVHARTARRPGDAGRGGRARRRDRPGNGSAPQCRPGERLRSRSRSIEDYDPAGRIHELRHAAERVAAAAQASGRLEFPFTLTARAENHIRGHPDLADTIARLQAFEAAGADVLYAPGLRTTDEIRSVCEAVS